MNLVIGMRVKFSTSKKGKLGCILELKANKAKVHICDQAGKLQYNESGAKFQTQFTPITDWIEQADCEDDNYFAVKASKIPSMKSLKAK